MSEASAANSQSPMVCYDYDCQVVGLEGFTKVHGLRHTFNSIMQMNGVDPATMSKILGHKDIETTMIYTHQTAEHLKKSIERAKIA